MTRYRHFRRWFLLILIMSSVVIARQAIAEVECEEIEATLISSFSGPFSTAGTIQGDLEGTTEFTGDMSSQTLIEGTTSPPLQPGLTFSYTGDLTIITEEGTLTTRSVGVFEASPLGAGTQFDRVISGTGKFSGASGLLYFNFIANTDLTGFHSEVRGEICTEEADDDDDDDDD